MGIHYNINASQARVEAVGSGKLTMPEMIAAVDEIAADARFHSGFSVVFDIQDAQYTAALDDGNAFVAALERRAGNFQKRFALVVPESLHVLGRLFCLLAQVKGIDRIQCFTDLAAAREWSGQSL